MKPEKGQIYEFYSGALDEVRTYELESFEDPVHFKGARARLRNLENGRYAEVTVAALSRRPEPGGSHWRFAAHPTTQPSGSETAGVVS